MGSTGAAAVVSLKCQPRNIILGSLHSRLLHRLGFSNNSRRRRNRCLFDMNGDLSRLGSGDSDSGDLDLRLRRVLGFGLGSGLGGMGVRDRSFGNSGRSSSCGVLRDGSRVGLLGLQCELNCSPYMPRPNIPWAS